MRNPAWSIVSVFLVASSAVAQNVDAPKAADPRLVVELVTAAPDIVHPVACDFDAKGRLLVVESHTHFAPAGYQGPKADRIQAFDVTKKGKPTTFFDGTRHTMDIAVHPDGSVYLATRNEILRLRDTKGTGVADEKTRIVFLDTKGDYPHNGLSGLCFDSKGDLTFGMGENLGVKYALIGSDGAKITGDEGGHIFHCSADGKKLRRVATGFWNPFGICRDIFGRVFAVDNDPDQSPPCRMLHVVEGGDYGFRFSYGRSGRHPFQSWHGELPGTLPMMTGVGEAPCEILSYESDGLPAEYRGQLLVTAWADHRVERYKMTPKGASFKAERVPFVQGGANFRPTGMCVAPDGSLYIADWVLSNYSLHGKGAIWHIRWKDAPKVERPDDPGKAILSMHRPLRELAARQLASTDKGRELLRKKLRDMDVRVRAAALTELIAVNDKDLDLKKILSSDSEAGVQELAIRAMDGEKIDLREFLDKKYPGTVRAEAIKSLGFFADSRKRLLELLGDSDPFLSHRATYELFDNLNDVLSIDPKQKDPRQRMGVLIARQRVSGVFTKDGPSGVAPFLSDTDDEVRFLAVKWIADKKLERHRADVEKMMANPKISVRMYTACATALARLDGKNVNEQSLANDFAQRLANDKTSDELRALLLRHVPTGHKALTVDLLTRLLKSNDASLKMEAVRALVEVPGPKRVPPLLALFRDADLDMSLRAYATLGLTDQAGKIADELLGIAKDAKSPLRFDAQRAIIGIKFAEGDLLRRPETNRPPAKDIDAWQKRLEGDADPAAGARVFFHPKLANCSRCHRIDGRGADVGPDLSGIGRTERRHILESILQPSATVAPHYVAWHLETADGKVRNGMLIHTNLDDYTYVDAKGDRFTLKTANLVEQRPTSVSIMPEGLADAMTDQELRDLLAYLQSRK